MGNNISKFVLFLSCSFFVLNAHSQFQAFHTSMRSINQIPLPAGFERTGVPVNSFADYLRHLPLRKDKTIYLYDHHPKSSQGLHYAVVDLSTGDKDLQQCADVVMRLRAEYFYDKKMYDSIRFPKGDHGWYIFSQFLNPGEAGTRENFMRFMEMIFINCGTYTLQRQLKPVADVASMQAGDVFIKGGAPGHAEIVVDIAINKQTGKKIYMLLEGYMPAQDMHILLDPVNTQLGPWYEINNNPEVITPTWIFTTGQLRRW